MRNGLVAIGLLLWLVGGGCSSSAKDTESPGMPSWELSQIDSLMPHRPDSALALLCGDVARDDTATRFDRHYRQLLLAEALYKNDYAQTDREAVMQSTAYFDSLVRWIPPFKGVPGRAGDSRHVHNRSDNIPYLSARAHYINGVGFYEQDSAVAACKEYITALETMESRFGQEDLVGEKAKFMVYIYNRLGDLFEEQLLTDPAITCFKQALHFRKRNPSEYGASILLYRIGIQFDITGQKDSAASYYDKALACLPDYNNIHYRDIMASKALLANNDGHCSDSVIKVLKHLVSLASDEGEKMTRFLTIGNILYEDRQYDSSRCYLEAVYEQQEDVLSRILAAENLCNIYQTEGDYAKANLYSSFLADFTLTGIERKAEVSKINEMFQDYLNQKQEMEAKREQKKAFGRAVGVIVSVFVMALAVIVAGKLRSRKLLKEHKAETERLLGETEQEHEKELKLWQAEADKTVEDTEKRFQELLQIQKNEAVQQARTLLPRRVSDLYRSKLTNRLERIMGEFDAAYPGALEQLAAAHPNLNEAERKIAVLNFLRFRAKEEADLTGFTENTTLKYRSNLNKKAGSDPITALITEGKI